MREGEKKALPDQDCGQDCGQDWRALRQKTLDLPQSLRGCGLFSVLLGYQQRLLRATSSHPVVVVEKSRRIGATWGIAAEAVLTAAAARGQGGMDVMYIGYNHEMTREFIETCALWARAFFPAADAVQEFLFKDQGERGKETQAILAFRIRFASGFEIVALSSSPRNLRGRQGWVMIDEAAFHDDLEEILKAALAFLLWGGRVLVISTHDGVENPFNALCEEVKAGKLPYYHMKIPFDEALNEGLYQRICLVTNKPWSAAGESAWRRSILESYGAAADEELHCIPRRSGGVWLPRALIEGCAQEGLAVLRFQAREGFVDEGALTRQREVDRWCDQTLAPMISRLDDTLQTFAGGDFARRGDKTVYWLLQREATTRQATRFVVELGDVPFEQQKQILFYLLQRCPRLSGVWLDATGLGGHLAEQTRQEFGTGLIKEVTLSVKWYAEHTPAFKAAFEDKAFSLPKHEDIITDFRGFKVIDGVARMAKDYRQKGTDGAMRHGDSAVAALLASSAACSGGVALYD